LSFSPAAENNGVREFTMMMMMMMMTHRQFGQWISVSLSLSLSSDKRIELRWGKFKKKIWNLFSVWLLSRFLFLSLVPLCFGLRHRAARSSLNQSFGHHDATGLSLSF
jgi:hypothetical protein